MAHYEIKGTDYPRTTTILNAYPEDEKGGALHHWAAKIAIRDLVKKMSLWDPSDVAEHIATLDEHFADQRKRKKERSEDAKIVNKMVSAHCQAWKEERDHLGDAGTLAHTFIENALRLQMGQQLAEVEADAEGGARMDSMTRYAMNAAMNWGRWYDARAKPHGFEPVAMELRCISPTLGYGGTPDCLARYKGGLWLFDWKTSNRIDPIKFGMQGVAYMALIEEECCWCEGEIVTKDTATKRGELYGDPVVIDGVAVVRCDRLEVAYNHHEVPADHIEPLWGMFRRCLDMVEAKSAFEKRIKVKK